MKVLLRLACFIVLLISLEADKCDEREENIIFFSSANEIDIRACPLNPNENKGTIIWYKNDSKTPISTELDSRIHQQKDKLWFVPAKVEDSGHYYCAVRNSTYCLKIKITAKILENEPNLCYNAQSIFIQRLHIAEDGSLVCPHLDFFKDENNELPKVQWYKDCTPLLLDNIHFSGVTNKLIMRNVTEEHRGNYTCHISYTYLARQYPVTRTIEFFTLEEIKPYRPVIVSPANETMEVDLGSNIQLICNVTGKASDLVFWQWNGSEVAFIDDPVLEEDYQLVENPSDKRKNMLITTLNISEVRSQFYLYPFTCLVKNTDKISAAYVQLVYPVPDFKNLMIGIFVTLTVIIVCSVFIYKIFKVDIVLWYRGSCSDFLPKKDAVEVTNENIKKSRRLIIILVKDMSGFCYLGHSSEEQIVMYNALVQDGIKVILLELEKIQDYEKMPESIKFIKQKHGAIRWSGDFREGPQSVKTRFWKNVRYHMPAQQWSPASKHQLLSVPTRPDPKEKLQRGVHLPLG
ncbi:interleukin-1 receptor type 1 isoform X3 [Castor canadensis]|uniref:Interleukin-1 receptor type 1 n=2 Tax=Castor canadensis TaxID=51338 RepID=A0A8B7U1H9_CASCN|nr:interleukin-1 receptor type 1 isoform X2 [Castor canadensis]